MLNKKGFTLLELIIVIIIIGILATLGIMQYQTVVEKSRGAEAKQVISTLRSACAAIYIQDGSTTNCTDANLNISSSKTIISGQIPGSDCWDSNYFSYAVSGVGGAGATFTATRCTEGGKKPDGIEGGSLKLEVNYLPGVGETGDTWTSSGMAY